MHKWQLNEAKARISELVKCAQLQPQEITLHGKSVAVLVSKETFDRLTSAQGSLVDFMQRSPMAGADDLQLTRNRSMARHVWL